MWSGVFFPARVRYRVIRTCWQRKCMLVNVQKENIGRAEEIDLAMCCVPGRAQILHHSQIPTSTRRKTSGHGKRPP